MTAQARSTAPDAWVQVREERGRLLVSWGSPNRETFEEIKAAFRQQFPRHSQAIYCPTDRAWSLPASQRHRLEEFVSTFFDDSAIEWDHPQAPPAPAHASALAEAYATLCVTPAAPIEVIAAARRILSKAVHPDREGGDELAQRRLNNAYDIIAAARDAARTADEFVAF